MAVDRLVVAVQGDGAGLVVFGDGDHAVAYHLIPYLVDMMGWHYAFAPLAAGPFLGVLAMARPRAHPDAVKLANGKR